MLWRPIKLPWVKADTQESLQGPTRQRALSDNKPRNRYLKQSARG